MTLKELFQEAIARYGTQAQAATAIGIDRTRISKVIQSPDDARESLELANCLRLARALGRPAGEVLAAAGKGDDHALIEELYGAEKPQADLTHDERQALALLRQSRGSDQIYQAVADESPLAAVRAYARSIDRLGKLLLTKLDERRDAEALVEPGYLVYRAGDLRSYWRALETLQVYLKHDLIEAIRKEGDERQIRDLRVRLRDATQALAAALGDQGTRFNPDAPDPDIGPLKRLADATLTPTERKGERERARLRRRIADDPDDPFSRSARLLRLDRLLYHERLILRDAEQNEADDAAENSRRTIRRLMREVEEALTLEAATAKRKDEPDELTVANRPRVAVVRGKQHVLLRVRGHATRALAAPLDESTRAELDEQRRNAWKAHSTVEDELVSVAISDSDDNEVLPTLRKLGQREAELYKQASQYGDRLRASDDAEAVAWAERRRQEEEDDLRKRAHHREP